jgi:hypothetical protein
MRNYRVNAATALRLDFGVELGLGLDLFPETAPLRADLQPAQDALETAYEDRRKRRKPLVEARVRVRLTGYLLRQTIRSAFKAAEIADGGRRGPICKAVFPEGLSAEVAPQGKAMIDKAGKLRDRLQLSKLPTLADYRKAWLPELQADVDGLTQAGAAHTAATKDYVDAFAVELAARQEHRRMVDRIAGEVRATFPSDKAKQDVVFPVPEEDPAEKDTAKPPPPKTATPASPAAPAGQAPT